MSQSPSNNFTEPVVAAVANSGALIPYCNNMLAVAPTFFANNQAKFIGQTSPAACVGNNLFTFLCERFIMSLTQLGCPMKGITNPVTCQLNGAGVATACAVNLKATATAIASTAVAGAATGTGAIECQSQLFGSTREQAAEAQMAMRPRHRSDLISSHRNALLPTPPTVSGDDR